MRKKGPKTKQKGTFKGNKGQKSSKKVEIIFWEKNFVKTCREREQKKPRRELRWLRWLKCAGLSNFFTQYK